MAILPGRSGLALHPTGPRPAFLADLGPQGHHLYESDTQWTLVVSPSLRRAADRLVPQPSGPGPPVLAGGAQTGVVFASRSQDMQLNECPPQIPAEGGWCKHVPARLPIPRPGGRTLPAPALCFSGLSCGETHPSEQWALARGSVLAPFSPALLQDLLSVSHNVVSFWLLPLLVGFYFESNPKITN